MEIQLEEFYMSLLNLITKIYDFGVFKENGNLPEALSHHSVSSKTESVPTESSRENPPIPDESEIIQIMNDSEDKKEIEKGQIVEKEVPGASAEVEEIDVGNTGVENFPDKEESVKEIEREL